MAAALPLLESVSRLVTRSSLPALRAAYRRYLHCQTGLFARPTVRRALARAAKYPSFPSFAVNPRRQSLPKSSRHRFAGGNSELRSPTNPPTFYWSSGSLRTPLLGGPVRTTFSCAPPTDNRVGYSVSPLNAAAIDVELEDEDGYREAPELDEEEEEVEPAGSRDHGTEERLVNNEKMLSINKAGECTPKQAPCCIGVPPHLGHESGLRRELNLCVIGGLTICIHRIYSSVILKLKTLTPSKW